MFNLIKIFMQLGYKYADLLDDDVFKKIFEMSELLNMD